MKHAFSLTTRWQRSAVVQQLQRRTYRAARNVTAALPSLSASRAPARVGDSLHDVDTPALLVDLNAFERNCSKLAWVMSLWPKVNIRPHCKAHKTAEVAHLQLKLLGAQAQGVCCQKVSEAEAMAEGGITDILLSNEVVAPRKISRLLGLAAAGARISVCVESEENLRAVGTEAARRGVQVGVLLEVNVGQNRCGIDRVEDVLTLGQAAVRCEGVKLLGIQAYHGGLQHVRTPAERVDKVGQVVEKARSVVAAMKAAGLPCDVVTGGGSGSYRVEAASGVYTEVQPGSFCFGDADYARNTQEDGSVGEWEQSLWVHTQVMSRSEARAMVVVDAGMKAISLDSGPPRLPTSFTDGVQVEYQSGGDEHGKLLWPQAVWQLPLQLPPVGTLLKLQPGHCDPTTNMYDWLMAYRGEVVEDVWSIRGRGPGA
mmetsp:Transcript_27126/g.59241  ORF Transcript_27126/g.59241 Transcript_27126/m.59241 type:complete len:427 (+) Transcript_27126:3-1283(+)